MIELLDHARDQYRFYTERDTITDSMAWDRIQDITNNAVYFLYELWKDRGFEDPDKAPLSDIEVDMFKFICDDRYFRRCALGCRGIGKTHEIAAFMTFRWKQDRNRQILLVSKSKDEAKKTLSLVRNWLDSVWFLTDLAPEMHSKDTTSAFAIAGTDGQRQNSMSVLGIGGQLEGNRAHDVIGDDIETKSNSKTLEARQELKRLWDESIRIVYPRKRPGDNFSIVAIGTPKHEDTIYLELKKQGYKVQSYPIRYPKDGVKTIELAPIMVERMATGLARPWEPSLPHRFNSDWVAIRESSSYHEFLREDMLVADLGDTARYPIKINNLIVTSVDRNLAPLRIVWGTSNHNGSTAIEDIDVHGLPGDRLYSPIHVDGSDWQPYTCTKASIDPAGKGNDRTGVAIGSMLAGMIWVKAVHGYQGGDRQETMDAIVAELHRWNAREVYVECNIDTFGHYVNLMEAAIKRRREMIDQFPLDPQDWSCAVIPKRAKGQKEDRIIGVLGPVINQHRMVIDRAAIAPEQPFDLDNDLQFQMSRITLQPRCLPEDGKIDALASLVQELESSTRADPYTAAEKIKQSRIDEMAKMQCSLHAAAVKLTGGKGKAQNFARHRG